MKQKGFLGRVLPVVEFLGVTVLLAGFGSAVVWFHWEALQLRQARNEITELQEKMERVLNEKQNEVGQQLTSGQQRVEEELETFASFQRKVENTLAGYKSDIERVEQARKEIDSLYRKLLGSLNAVEDLKQKYAEFEVVEREKDGRQERVVVRGAGEIFFHDDFSQYSPGDMPVEWGQGVAVFTDKNNRSEKYLGAASRNAGFLSRDIAFPDNFSLQWSDDGFMGTQTWNAELEDARGKKLQISTIFTTFQRELWMTGAKKVQRSQIRDYNGFNVVRIEVRGNTARLFVNEGFVVSTRIDEYANFVRIRMSHDPWEYFKVDNFHAIDLGEEVQAVRE